jgi:hypothetical protein
LHENLLAERRNKMYMPSPKEFAEIARAAMENAEAERNGVEYSDSINPDHYKWIKGVECYEVTSHFNFNLGNAIKYIWRCNYKGSKVEDLKKAIWYLQKEIEKEED